MEIIYHIAFGIHLLAVVGILVLALNSQLYEYRVFGFTFIFGVVALAIFWASFMYLASDNTICLFSFAKATSIQIDGFIFLKPSPINCNPFLTFINIP